MKKQLKDICTLEKGKQIDTKLLDDSNQYRYINGGIKESGFFNDYNTEGETVLISEGGASCGYVNYINEKFWCGCHCYRLTNINIFPKYLFYSLKGSQQGIMDLRTGAAMPNIKKETLKDFEITVCDSLPDQQKIAHHLDTIQSAIDNKKQQLSHLDELVKSKFVEMFGENPVESGKWKVEKFTDIAKIDGTMVKDFEKYADYPHIGIDSIEKNTGELKGYRTVKEDNVISGKYFFTSEHIIYSKIRPNLNKVALPTFDGLCSADAYPILVFKDKCNRYYLAYVMRSEYFLNYILAFASRAGMPKVNREQICGFILAVPPIDLQNTFAQYVQKIDAAKSIIKTQLVDLQELLDSKMDEYFGE